MLAAPLRSLTARFHVLPLLLAAIFLASGLAAQVHPNHAQGFEPQKAYQVGDIENVNLFNGNITLTLPIGQEYAVGGELSFGLGLTYTGNIWEWEEDYLLGPSGYEYYLKAIPRKRSNAGLGWELHLGRLNPPRSRLTTSTSWVYESPDGALHELHLNLHSDGTQTPGFLYTRDGTYLRLDTAQRKVEFPDGTMHWFDSSGDLSRIEDRHGNRITVTTYTNPTRWVLADDHGRSQTVYFKDAVYYGTGSVVDRVEVAAFGGAKATYTFNYAERYVTRGWTNPYPINNGLVPRTIEVPLLTGVTLPDGSTYSMPVSSYDLGPASGTSTLSGHLQAMRLPTGGELEWDWDLYYFPQESAKRTPVKDGAAGISPSNPFRLSAGVVARRHRDIGGSLLGEWTYQPELDSDTRKKEHRVTVTDPLSHPTTYYFSVYHDDLDPATPEPAGYYHEEYGLPFSRKTSDGTSPGRFVSAKIRDSGGALLRTIYLRYERDGLSAANPRLASKRAVFHDDSNRYKDIDHSGFDGVGHYRTTATDGNYPAGNVRTTFTNYNPGWCATCQPSTGTAWILDTYTEQRVTEGGATAKTELCWDRGLLTRTRTLRTGTSRSSSDLVTWLVRNTAGNVTSEQSFGGDTQFLGTAGLCGLSLPAARYRVDHTYQYGSVRTSKYSGASFYSLDRNIDRNTGLPWRSFDSAGLSTVYEYDTMGRLTWEKPAQDGWMRYFYFPYDPATGNAAQVKITRRDNNGWSDLTERRIRFDGLGRVWLDETLMPNGSRPRKETLYDGAGNVYSVSNMGNTAAKTYYLRRDPFGRPEIVRPPEGSSHDVTFVYYGDRVTRKTVQIGTGRDAATGAILETEATTITRRDGQGRTFQVLEPSNPDGSNATATYSYDVGGRLAQVSQTAKTTGGTNVTQTRLFNYDNRGFLLSERHPEKGSSGNGYVTYSNYDARGHAGRVTDGPNELRFTYDGSERLTKVEESLGYGLWRPLKTFTYATANTTGNFKNGKLELARRYNYPALGTTTYEAVVNETYTYGGKQGRVSSRETTMTFNGSTHERFTQSWTYNDLGAVANVGYPECHFAECNNLGGSRTVSHGYTQGFLTSVGGYASSIAYHDNGLYSRIDHTNGIHDDQLIDSYLNPRPRVLRSKFGTTLRWSTGAYSYDGAGNVVKTQNSWYLYDGVSRVKDGTLYLGPGAGGASDAWSHTYDGFGNLQSISTATSRNTPTSSSTNRLTGNTSYDAAGSLTYWNGATYEYDALGMLKRVANGAEKWLYMYTADDERFWAFKEGASPRFDRFWIRDLDGKVLRTWETTGYVWSWAEDHIYRDGKLLAAETASSGRKHFHLDHLGTPRAITNSAGNRIDYHAYYPFGEEATAFNQDTETMKFTGHERDLGDPTSPADDLDYMHARYYNPQLGRFLSTDPVDSAIPTSPQGWNKYGYALDNPIRYTDPDGESPWDSIKGFGNAFASNLSLGLYARVESNNPDFKAGQRLGDQAALVAGLYEASQGSGAVAGAALCTAGSAGGCTPAAAPAAAAGVVAIFHGGAVAAMAGQNLAMQMEGGGSGGGRTPAQDKILTKGEIKKLKEAGIDPHELKGGKGASKYDLYKDRTGNVYVKRKGGKGTGEETGLNLDRLPK